MICATQIKAGTPEYARYGFAAYYATCLFVNWWFYARKNAEISCWEPDGESKNGHLTVLFSLGKYENNSLAWLYGCRFR